jgi:hypothetical protein
MPHGIHSSTPVAIAMRSFASLQRGDYPARDDNGSQSARRKATRSRLSASLSVSLLSFFFL